MELEIIVVVPSLMLCNCGMHDPYVESIKGCVQD